MTIRMLQGFGAGFATSILLGYLFGALEFIYHPAGPILLMILIYLVTGWGAGYDNEHPYLSAWLASTGLFFINLLVTVKILGESEITLLGIVFSWILALIGAWIGKLTTRS
jgi:hypothetical protein